MTDRDRKRYEELDDIGIIGFQDNRTDAQIKREARKTARFIEAYKAKMKQGKLKGKKSGPATSK